MAPKESVRGRGVTGLGLIASILRFESASLAPQANRLPREVSIQLSIHFISTVNETYFGCLDEQSDSDCWFCERDKANVMPSMLGNDAQWKLFPWEARRHLL